jgi:hypothetical protein
MGNLVHLLEERQNGLWIGEVGPERKNLRTHALQLTGCTIRFVLGPPVVQADRVPILGQDRGKRFAKPVSGAGNQRKGL